jgi:hypothetical protein
LGLCPAAARPVGSRSCWAGEGGAGGGGDGGVFFGGGRSRCICFGDGVASKGCVLYFSYLLSCLPALPLPFVTLPPPAPPSPSPPPPPPAALAWARSSRTHDPAPRAPPQGRGASKTTNKKRRQKKSKMGEKTPTGRPKLFYFVYYFMPVNN